MEPTRLFQNYMCKFIDLSDDEFNSNILPAIKIRKFHKKELITKAGEVEPCPEGIFSSVRDYSGG